MKKIILSVASVICPEGLADNSACMDQATGTEIIFFYNDYRESMSNRRGSYLPIKCIQHSTKTQEVVEADAYVVRGLLFLHSA